MKHLIMRFKRKGLHRQQGFTLLEALISLLLVTAGLLAAYRFNSTTIAFSAESNVRAYAITFAEAKLEELRNFQDSDDFDAIVIDGPVADPGADDVVDYTSSTLTRSWVRNEGYGNGDNPRQIDVTVSWEDKLGDPQSVVLSSVIWRNSPGRAAKNLFLALNSDGNSVDDFGDSDGNIVDAGGDSEGGRVIVTEVTIQTADHNADADADGVYSYNIEFFGDIVFTDDGLSSVGISGGPDDSASCDIVESNRYEAGIQEAGTAFDAAGGEVLSTVADDPVRNSSGIALFDVYGAAAVYSDAIDQYDGDVLIVDELGDAVQSVVETLMIVAEGAGGFLYRCEIIGVPDGTVSWTGSLTYVPAGNDAVCTPGPSLDDLEIILNPLESRTEYLDLAVVVMTNNGACP